MDQIEQNGGNLNALAVRSALVEWLLPPAFEPCSVSIDDDDVEKKVLPFEEFKQDEISTLPSIPNGSTNPTESANKNECKPLSSPFGVNGGGEVPLVELLKKEFPPMEEGIWIGWAMIGVSVRFETIVAFEDDIIGRDDDGEDEEITRSEFDPTKLPFWYEDWIVSFNPIWRCCVSKCWGESVSIDDSCCEMSDCSCCEWVACGLWPGDWHGAVWMKAVWILLSLWWRCWWWIECWRLGLRCWCIRWCGWLWLWLLAKRIGGVVAAEVVVEEERDDAQEGAGDANRF